MKVLAIILFLIISLRVVLSITRRARIKDNSLELLFTFVIYAILIFLAAFRSENVGTDTIGYSQDYYQVQFVSFKDIPYQYQGYEGYYYTSKIFATVLNAPLWVWFAFVEFVFISAIARLINRFSKDKLYSILILVTSGLYMFSLAGLKQTLAMAVFIHAYMGLVDKQYIRFMLLNVLVYLIHPVVIIGNIVSILYVIRNSKYFYICLFIIAALLCFGTMTFMTYLVKLSGNEHFEIYLIQDSSYSKATLYLYIFVLGCTLPFVKKLLKDNVDFKVLFAGSMLVCLFQYTASFSTSLFRLAFCFLPFFISFVPNVFAKKYRKSLSITLSIAVMLGLVFFCLYANRNLSFTLKL